MVVLFFSSFFPSFFWGGGGGGSFLFFRHGSCKNWKRIPVLLFKHTHTHTKKTAIVNIVQNYLSVLWTFISTLYVWVLWRSARTRKGGGVILGPFHRSLLIPRWQVPLSVRLISLVLVDVCLSDWHVSRKPLVHELHVSRKPLVHELHANCLLFSRRFARAQRVPSGCGSLVSISVLGIAGNRLDFSFKQTGYKMCLTQSRRPNSSSLGVCFGMSVRSQRRQTAGLYYTCVWPFGTGHYVYILYYKCSFESINGLIGRVTVVLKRRLSCSVLELGLNKPCFVAITCYAWL